MFALPDDERPSVIPPSPRPRGEPLLLLAVLCFSLASSLIVEFGAGPALGTIAASLLRGLFTCSPATGDGNGPLAPQSEEPPRWLFEMDVPARLGAVYAAARGGPRVEPSRAPYTYSRVHGYRYWRGPPRAA